MKHLVWCLLLSLMLPSASVACDLCNMYLGVNPHYNQNTIGLRYRYRNFIPSGNGDNEMMGSMHMHHHEPMTSEFYNTYEMWGKFYPHPKVQLLVSVPFAHNMEFEESQKTADVKGMGDVMIIAHYQIFNTSPNDSITHTQQRLFIGGGIKAPTGKFNQINTSNEIDPHIQTGSGSWDYILSGVYLVKFGKAGFTTDLSYKLNTINSNQFKFANRLNATASVFYQKYLNSFTFIPNTGLYFEQAQMDKENSVPVDDSGGQVLFYSLGLDCYYKKVALNLSGQLPVYQNLYGSQPINNSRFIIGLNYSF